MLRLISWTGWTKEDWKEALKFLAKGVFGGIVVWGLTALILVYFG